ncbi:MAG: AAA family ATPase, partial [Clostridiales bacterium]|nr:AAA family ATPase [Clostridiales bacterium]
MIKTLTFFNNKGGVGKTSLAYHLAWTYADLGKTILAADLDPQSNLTAAFMTEDEIAELWDEGKPGTTIFDCVKPVTSFGDIAEPKLINCGANLYFLPGHVALSKFEDNLSREWPNSLDSRNLYRPMRILSAF